MGPFGMNPWLSRYVLRRARQEPPPAPASVADPLREIDDVAAAAWQAWTPEQSATDEFKARFMASLIAYYRRRPLV